MTSFDLGRDSGELDDLSAARPADAARLKARLNRYLTFVCAQSPTVNPACDGKTPTVEPRPKAGGRPQGKPKKERPPAAAKDPS